MDKGPGMKSAESKQHLTAGFRILIGGETIHDDAARSFGNQHTVWPTLKSFNAGS